MSESFGFLPNFFVMTFSVNGIKQEKNEKYPVEMLVCVDASLLARKILEERNILILSLKEFTPDKETFGDIYFTIQQNFKKIQFVTKHTDIQEACDFFSFVGFDIDTINRFSAPISQEESQKIIALSKKAAEKKKNEVQQAIEAKEAKERKVYQDADLESAKKIILRIFEKVDETLKRSDGQIGLKEMKQITSLTEELKKLRMGTNLEKIRETIQDLFAVVEKINIEYYQSIQDFNATISKESLVTEIDVLRELERMENIKILKSLGAKIAIKNKDYSTFGSGAIFRKFLQKDFLSKITNLPEIFSSFYDIIELIVLVALCLLGVYTLANEIYLFSLNQF